MRVVIRGGGDIATGIALRLIRSGMEVVICEQGRPTAIRRTVSFSEAMRLGETVVEGITARRAHLGQVEGLLARDVVPVLEDPSAGSLPGLRADAVVDAILAKVNLGTRLDMAPVVVGVGLGGTSEVAALLAKRSLLRPVDQRSPDPFYAGMEAEALERINALGIGPQGLGGSSTALSVAITPYPTHIAGLPCAVNLGCHVTRHAHTQL